MEMSVSSWKCLVREFLAVILVFAFPASLLAQEAQPAPAQSAGSAQASLPQAPTSNSSRQPFEIHEYSSGHSAFPNVIAPYTPKDLPLPDFSNSPRLDQLLREGKLYLSMDDAVALALENNLDIAISRYNFGIADTEVLRSKGGANNFFGVPTGIVQNTPGGGVGGLSGNVGSGPGGTTAAPGGIGAGTAGLVSSTLGLGPTITSFDPIVTATLQNDHARFECTSIFCGTVQNTSTANFNYVQGLHSSTNISVGFTNSRIASNNPFTIVSP